MHQDTGTISSEDYRPTDTSVNTNTDENLINMVEEKARQIFSLCDCDNKGYITKEDMRRLEAEFPIDGKQLDEVFDRLDTDSNGKLTQDSFVMYFGNFLGISNVVSKDEASSEKTEVDHEQLTAAEEEEFCELIKSFHVYNVIDDLDTIKSVWLRLNRHQPQDAKNFEDLLQKISNEMNRKHMDYHQLQISLRNKTTAHDEEMVKMYEEMEELIALEKQELKKEETFKKKQMESSTQKELHEKDERLKEIINQQEQMTQKLMELNASETLARQESERLAKEKEVIEEMLDSSHHRLERSRSQVEQLRRERREEKKRRVIAATQISEWIALERESLAKQLQVLKEMNRRLRDDDDEEDEDKFVRLTSNQRNYEESSLQRSAEKILSETPRSYRDYPAGLGKQQSSSASSYWWDESDDRDMDDKELRQQPIGATATSEDSDQNSAIDDCKNTQEPSRVFKIILVGDSGVGKTSLLHRVCSNNFTHFTSTIGIDFQVHNVRLDDEVIALQMWDTAGQERFRSFTQQYFRKADGVLLIYDVTSEPSFKNIRQWLDSVKKAVEDNTLVVVIGNKIDLLETNKRSVPIEEAAGFAMKTALPYFETSAKTGDNAKETFHKIASMMKEREVKLLQNSFQLEEKIETTSNKSSTCCNLRRGSTFSRR